MDYRRQMDYRKKMENQKMLKIRNPAFNPKELRKIQTNKAVSYPDYPQREDIPNLPLPANISWVLKDLESRFFDQIDEFYPMAEIEELTQTQYGILAGGVKRNMVKLQMTEAIWSNSKSLAEFIAAGKIGHTSKLLVAYNYRIHLEALRILSGMSLMDILYKGEICVQNEIFDAGEKDFYMGICKRLTDMLEENPDLDITTLSYKDLDAWRA